MRVPAGAAGVVLRAVVGGAGYRFTIDRATGRRRLVRTAAAGSETVLAEDRFAPRAGTDYELSLEAVGTRLRAFLDGVAVFDVTDNGGPAAGKAGVHTTAAVGARFRDFRVDDVRAGAPVVYRFKFTTSRFATFVHHLHSGDDVVRRAEQDLSALLGAGVSPGPVIGETEQRAFEAIAAAVLGPAARRERRAAEVAAVEDEGDVQALLVETAEPVDWRRATLTVTSAPIPGVSGAAPANLKVTEAAFGIARPNEEWVDLLLLDAADPSGARVERLVMPGALDEAAAARTRFSDDFGGPAAGQLLSETFPLAKPDRYELLGAVALHRAGPWPDVRMTATFTATGTEPLGLILRHDGAGSGYRFTVDPDDGRKRLVRTGAASDTVLWEGTGGPAAGAHRMVVEASGERLLGWLDDVLQFDVEDRDLATGRVGLAGFGAGGTPFTTLQVDSLERSPVLWRPELTDVSEVEVFDHPRAAARPSAWSAVGGALVQGAATGRPPGGGPRPVGLRPTIAAGGDPAWTDVRVTVRARGGGAGAIGLAVRFTGPGDHYRFVLGDGGRTRTLERVVRGRATTLWSDRVQRPGRRLRDLTLDAEGSTLRVVIAGKELCTVTDATHRSGRVAVLADGAPGARFERLLVADRVRTAGGWRIEDAGPTGGPSVWRREADALAQASSIGGGNAPAEPGTIAVGGPVVYDARIEARLRCDAEGSAGLVFRHRGSDDHYRLSLDSVAARGRLVKLAGGTATVLWEAPGAFSLGEPFTLTVDTLGSRLIGRLDGAPLFDVTDAAHASGRVGLYAAGQTGLRAEHVDVSALSLEAPALLRGRFWTGSLAGWTALDDGTRGGPSAWSTAGSEVRETSGIGSPARLRSVARRGTQLIAGDTGWGDVIFTARVRLQGQGAGGLIFRRAGDDDFYRFALDADAGVRRLIACEGGRFSTLWEDAAGVVPGRPYVLTVAALGSMLRGWIDGVPAFVVEHSGQVAGAIALYAHAATEVRFSDVIVLPADVLHRDWLLDETFAAAVPDRWAYASSGAGSGSWAIAAGALLQTGDADRTSAVAGDAGWRDYRVSVTLRNDGAGAVGVLARQTPEGHYALRLRSDGCSLMRVTPAAEQVLWSDTTRGLAPSRDHVVTLDCVGSRITGWLDGRRLFVVDDEALASGRVGVRAEQAPGARFAEVRVGAPAWALLHRLGAEELLAAGTRLRLHPGGPDDAPPRAPGVQPRFAALPGEHGRLHLPHLPQRLRVIEPDGAAGHERDVRPAADYTTSGDVRVVRRADGTAFAVWRAGGPLVAADVRLALDFARDAGAASPELPVLSSGGETAPERAQLDVPLGRATA